MATLAIAVLRAVWDFTPQSPDEVALYEGQTLFLLERDDSVWWTVKVNHGEQDEVGVVPSAFVEELEPSATAYAQNDYVGSSAAVLSVSRGERVQLYQDVNGWSLVQRTGQRKGIGYVPSGVLGPASPLDADSDGLISLGAVWPQEVDAVPTSSTSAPPERQGSSEPPLEDLVLSAHTYLASSPADTAQSGPGPVRAAPTPDREHTPIPILRAEDPTPDPFSDSLFAPRLHTYDLPPLESSASLSEPSHATGWNSTEEFPFPFKSSDSSSSFRQHQQRTRSRFSDSSSDEDEMQQAQAFARSFATANGKGKGKERARASTSPTSPSMARISRIFHSPSNSLDASSSSSAPSGSGSSKLEAPRKLLRHIASRSAT